MIQLSSLTKAFGVRVLFENVTWQIGDGDRVGLCGPNGAGKTTLLRMLAGFEEPDGGGVIRPSGLTVGYLPQDGLTHSERTVFDEAAMAFADVLAAKAEIHALEDRLGDASIPDGEHDAMLVRYSDLQEQFRRQDGYSIELKTTTVLQGLGFEPADFTKPSETLSGGWQMRLALAKLLLGRPGLLLLDEPTNHLDLDARNWLESYLSNYPHAVILVSHDRYFLDAVVTRITDVNLRTLTDYHGNYSAYVTERDARLERLRTSKREQDDEVARIKQFIDRFRYKATKAAQVQSRIKMLEKVVPIEAPPERKRVHFQFPICAKSGRTVFDVKDVRKAYGDVTVFTRLNLHIERGDRIALVGHNGAGKSTLMRMLSGVEGPDAGVRHEGHQVVMEYFAQDEATRLDPTKTVYETLEQGSPLGMVPAIRNVLGGFLFSGDDITKRVTVLSGGERTRLAVARMLLRPSNTLLLDEPTNHLDLDSKDVLLDALMDYGGTLIFVSHDRYFVERLATKIVDVGGGDAVVYPGAYTEFLWSKAHPTDAPPSAATHAAAKTEKPASHPPRTNVGASHAARDKRSAAPSAGAAERSPTNGPDPREERKRVEAEARRRQRDERALKSRIADLEARIAEKEREIKTIETQMAEPGFYDDREQSRPVIDRREALMWEVGDLMHRWEQLQTGGQTA